MCHDLRCGSEGAPAWCTHIAKSRMFTFIHKNEHKISRAKLPTLICERDLTDALTCHHVQAMSSLFISVSLHMPRDQGKTKHHVFRMKTFRLAFLLLAVQSRAFSPIHTSRARPHAAPCLSSHCDDNAVSERRRQVMNSLIVGGLAFLPSVAQAAQAKVCFFHPLAFLICLVIDETFHISHQHVPSIKGLERRLSPGHCRIIGNG